MFHLPAMTERLYYNDSYLRAFDARVVHCAPAGAGWRVILDRTAFYPASGGQPCDTGKLGGAHVLDVVDEVDAVAHLTDAPVNGAVQGSIDWARRFDHMQQHTGQHILSGALVELFNLPTVSFHLGRETCTIDLPQQPTAAQLEAAELRANAVVFADVPVEVMYGTAAELEKIGVRKAVEREGVLRAISIREFDRQPCGGTHVARTGGVGLILLRKIEKQKQNCRVEFVCGERALRCARADYAALTDTARVLGCGPGEAGAGVRRMQEEQKAAQKRQQMVLATLAGYEAAALLANAAAGSPRRVVKIYDDAEPGYLRLLASEIVKQPGALALLGTRCGGHVVFAQSKGMAGDMSQLLRAALQGFGGKGGGTRDFAQGAIPDAGRLEEALARATE